MSENNVSDIRKQIDTLDNRLHDLLIERAALVLRIGEEKRRNNVQIIQPDREIVMIRRLLARHKGPLPKEAIVRIWRELVGAVSLLQTGLKVVVCAPDDHTGLHYWDMAKDYFSSVLPMQKVSNPLSALSMVRENEVTFAVVPWPEDELHNPWWGFLLDETGDHAMRIVARLPLGDRTACDSTPEHRALVVARLKYEESGEDRTFMGLEIDEAISRGRVVDKAREIGMDVTALYTCPGFGPGKKLHLIEADGFYSVDEEWSRTLLAALGDADGKCLSLGGYPVPPVYEDKVGKGALESAADDNKTRKKA